MVFLNELRRYITDESLTGVMIVNREFREYCDIWNINVCSSLDILISNRDSRHFEGKNY